MSFLRKGTGGSSSSPASPVTAPRSRTDSKTGSASTPGSPRQRADSSKASSNGSVALPTPSSPLGSTSSSSSSFSSSSSSSSLSSSPLSAPTSPGSRSMTVSGGGAPVVKAGGPAKMQGFLQKQNPHGITKSCKKRWFVLKDFQLSYFLSNTDTKPLGIIDLHIVERIYTKAENFGFVLSTPKREYILFASSTDERKVWMNEIKKSIYELRVAKQQAALSPAKRDQLSALKRVQVIDRSIVNTLETKGSGSSSSSSPSSPSSSSSSSPSSSPPSPSRVPALNISSGSTPLAQQVASPRTKAAATVAAANMTPVKKRPNSEELKVTFSKLETLEKDLKGLRTSREQLERAEMKLLFKSLDPSKFNAKLRGDRINYERQIDQIDSEIEALEKRISFLNEELQDGINFHFDWERLRQLSIQS